MKQQEKLRQKNNCKNAEIIAKKRGCKFTALFFNIKNKVITILKKKKIERRKNIMQTKDAEIRRIENFFKKDKKNKKKKK